MSFRLDRRRVLRAGSITVALPLMESLLPRSAAAVEQASRTPRLATIAEPFGVIQERFFPKTTGRDYELSPTLKPMEPVKSEFTVFSNLDHGVRGGHQANHTLWSGIKNTDRASYPDGNITVDQRAAELVGHNTRYPSLVFWTEKNSFTRTGVSVPSIQTPSEAFNRMFVDDTAEKRRFDRETIDASGSILDTVLADAESFKRRLGRTDQKKLDEYFNSIRETEKKLELAESWIDQPKPRLDDPVKEDRQWRQRRKNRRQLVGCLARPDVPRVPNRLIPSRLHGNRQLQLGIGWSGGYLSHPFPPRSAGRETESARHRGNFHDGESR